MSSIRDKCRKVVAIGRNYADHITELNSARPKQPFFFLKPTTTIHPPGSGPVIRPKGVELSYEIELGVVVSKRLKDLPSTFSDQDALDAISGYCLSIDMTARNAQWEAKKKGLPWSICKGFDTFLPVSEFIPKDRIEDMNDIVVELSVNGKVQQHDNTNLMLFRLPRMLVDISRVMTLEEGDLIVTGTPKGVGPVVPGDTMVGKIVDEQGKEIPEAHIEVGVKESESEYVYTET